MFAQPRLRYRRLAMLLLALVLVGACMEIPTFSTEPSVSLRIAVPNQVQAVYLKERVKSFEQENPTIKVEVFSQMQTFRGNLASAITTLSTSSTGLDLVYLTDQDFQSLGEAGVLTDLTSYIRESEDLGPSQFYPLALPVFQTRGRQMVMPAELFPLVVFYNQDLFDQASLKYPTADWTVQDFQAAAKRLTDESGGTQKATYGYVGDATLTVWPFVFAFGGGIPDATRDPRAQTLTSAGTMQGFQFVVDLISRDKSFPIDPPGRTIGLWYGGRAGMTLQFMNGRNSVPQQTDARGPVMTPTPGPKPTWGFRWNVAPVPGQAKRSTLVQVAGYAITKGAKNPDEAWQLIRYLVGTLPEPGVAPGFVPALRSLARSEEFGRLYPESGRQAYLDSVNFGQSIPQTPSTVAFTENDIRQILRGEVSVSDTLQQLQQKYAKAFEKLVQ